MTEALPPYGIAALTPFTATILERAGLREADAEVSADILVTSDVYGIESHGIVRLGYYVNIIDVEASSAVERETAVTAVVDARNGFGPPAARLTMTGCLEKAQRAGLAMVTVRNSNHFGIAGYYAMLARRAKDWSAWRRRTRGLRWFLTARARGRPDRRASVTSSPPSAPTPSGRGRNSWPTWTT